MICFKASMTNLMIAVLVTIFLCGEAAFFKTRIKKKIIATNCSIICVNAEQVLKNIRKDGVRLYKFKLYIARNQTYSLLELKANDSYNPWRWFKTKSMNDLTFLRLPSHFAMSSLGLLNHAVEDIPVGLNDRPTGCFDKATFQTQLDLVNMLILNNCQVNNTYNSETDIDDDVCRETIREENGYAVFNKTCCFRQGRGDQIDDMRCYELDDNRWIQYLYISMAIINVLVVLFWPLCIPSKMYAALSSEYVVNLKQTLQLKLLITEDTYKYKGCKTTLVYNEISQFNKFREDLASLPRDEIVSITIEAFRIHVKEGKLIRENDPPTGLIRTLYENIIGCKIQRIRPFNECCVANMYAPLEKILDIRHTWGSCTRIVVKILMLCIIPLPFYARLIFYLNRSGDVLKKRESIERHNLKENFEFHFASTMLYLTPTHGIYTATYVLYFLFSSVVLLSGQQLRIKVKDIFVRSFQDLKNLSQVCVIRIILRIGLWPLRKFGVFAVFILPIYYMITLPISTLAFMMYCIPLFYVPFRLCVHSWESIGQASSFTGSMTGHFMKIRKVKRTLSEVDDMVHKRPIQSKIQNCCPSSKSVWNKIKIVVLRVVLGIVLIIVFYALTVLMVECISTFIEAVTFVMMGIIVNSESTMKYVSMVLLVLVYMYGCYNSVYKRYVQFNQSIVGDVINRVDDLRQIASLPSSIQENVGFQIQPVKGVIPAKAQFELKRREIRCLISSTLLFLDSYDMPRIPRQLFEKMCSGSIHGAPGPVYINLIRATGKFLVIVVFLLFVFFVVAAFGNSYKISSTNQTLAAMAGGFIPFLLTFIIPSNESNISLNSVSFQGQMDEIISDYKQYWSVADIICSRDVRKPGQDSCEKELLTYEIDNNHTEYKSGEEEDAVFKCGEEDGDVSEQEDVDLLIDLTPSDRIWKVSNGSLPSHSMMASV